MDWIKSHRYADLLFKTSNLSSHSDIPVYQENSKQKIEYHFLHLNKFCWWSITTSFTKFCWSPKIWYENIFWQIQKVARWSILRYIIMRDSYLIITFTVRDAQEFHKLFFRLFNSPISIYESLGLLDVLHSLYVIKQWTVLMRRITLSIGD